MKTRSANAVVTFKGRRVSTKLGDYMTSFSYEESDNGESDAISISMADPDGRWANAWFPSKGDKMSAYIKFYDRDKEGVSPTLNCGSFTLDSIGYSWSSSGSTLTMSGVSAPASESFSATSRTKTWESVTLKRIASDIAKRYKLKLLFDCPDVKVATVEQSATDSAFLETVCKEYGRHLKVYNNTIVIFDRERYKKKSTVAKINKSEMISLSYDTEIAGSYTGGEISYTDPNTKSTMTCKVGRYGRMYRATASAGSLAEAEIKLRAALANANHSTTTISFSIMGRPDLCPGQCIRVEGIGRMSGKYYIDKKTDSLGGSGYTSSIKASKV